MTQARTAVSKTDAPAVDSISGAIRADAATFASALDESSLIAAVDIWQRRMAKKKLTPMQRARLVKAVQRASAPETRDIQLLRAGLLRAAGLDERPAAAAAVAAGATYSEVGEILGMTQQGANKRVKSYLDASGGRVEVVR